MINEVGIGDLWVICSMLCNLSFAVELFCQAVTIDYGNFTSVPVQLIVSKLWRLRVSAEVGVAQLC